MIAQGAFMRVLNAETSEKTEILRAIFNTERFSMMQDELKATADQYKNDYLEREKRKEAERQRHKEEYDDGYDYKNYYDRYKYGVNNIK